MIKLIKLPEPAILSANQTVWTEEFALNNKSRSYAHPDVRQQLRAETHEKCVYCESKMEHVSPSHIEHIYPKSVRPDLVCDWNNMTLACERCNNAKRDYHNEINPLLNPYVDEPNAHLEWYGPMIMHKSPDRGRLTIAKLKLNRPDLLYQRAQKISRVKDILDLIQTSQPAVASALREEIALLTDSESEYSAAVSSFVESY